MDSKNFGSSSVDPDKDKHANSSFTHLQIDSTFTHYRSVSYFEAISNITSSSSHKSRLGAMCASDQQLKQAQQQRHSLSCSTPSTPKKSELEKCSTLPSSGFSKITAEAPRKSRSSSLSNFFAKLKPRFHRSAIDMKNPWIIIEFSPQSKDNVSCAGSDRSDHSFEAAARTKEQHFTSLKDLHESESCKCILSSSNCVRRPLSGSDFFSSHHTVKNTNKHNAKSQNDICSSYRSESSVFFRLSPRRRFERIKHALRNLTKRNKCRKCSSAGCLDSRVVKYRKDTCGKSTRSSLPRDASFLSQHENGNSSQSTTVLFTAEKRKNSEIQGCRNDSYLKVPLSRSFDAKLCSTVESSTRPASLSLASRGHFSGLHVERARAKMASVESIGSCSLDLDASDPAESYRAQCVTASEFTLQSAKLVPSVNGSHNSVGHHTPNGTEDRRFRTELILKNGFGEYKSSLTANGIKESKTECTVAEIKLPSYVSISCAINGYANYSRFCRSRDNSPARSFRKSSLEAGCTYDSSIQQQSSKANDNVSSSVGVRCSRSHSDCNGNARTVFMESKHVTISKQLQIPLHSPRKYMTEIVINSQHSPEHVENACASKTTLNGHSNEKFLLASEVGNGAKSLVQQRIESLYGVSAEEKVKVPSRAGRMNTVQTNRNLGSSTVTKRSPSCPPEVLKGQLDNSLPVFRHLRKDFREQLLLEDSTSAKSTSCIRNKRSLSRARHEFPEEKCSENGMETKLTPTASESPELRSQPHENGFDECDRSIFLAPSVTSVILDETKTALDQDRSGSLQSDRDGHAFLSTMEACKQEIQESISKWEKELQHDIPDDALGKIRSACGKANLLLSQKFEQFRELCLKNIEETPDVPYYTTASDLEGFWDMVMLQVNHVNETFKDIESMKHNSWQEIKKTPISHVKSRKSAASSLSKSNPCTPKRTAKSAELARAREEARKQLLAAKKKGRQQNTNVSDSSDVAIFTPDT